MTPSDRICLAVAAEGLGSRDGDYPDSPLDQSGWMHLLSAAKAGRLSGMLWAAVERGAFPVTDEQERELEALQVDAMVAAVELEALLLDAVEWFDSEGIPSRVIKGPASAHLLYPDPSLRPFGDIDLLVPASEISGACRILESRSGRRRFPEPRPSYDREFGKGVSVVMPGALEIDLHRTLSPGPYGLSVRLEDLFQRCWTFDLGGKGVSAPPADVQLVAACYHAVLGSADPPPMGLRDVVQLVTNTDAATTAPDLARAWRGEAVLARGILEAWSALGPTGEPPLVSWARSFQPGTRDRRWLRAATGSTRSGPRQVLQGLEVVPGPAAKLRYLHAVLVPRGSANPWRVRWRRGWDELAPKVSALRGARGHRGSS